MRLTGGQVVARALKEYGVEFVAGVPGHGIWSLFDAFLEKDSEIPFIQVMHEQSAVHMADGYFRAQRPTHGLLHFDRTRRHQHDHRFGHVLRRLHRRLLRLGGAAHPHAGARRPSGARASSGRTRSPGSPSR